ncbi:MAG: hypothetical protein ABL927_05345 [Bdellovibrionales bacterium]
MKKEERMLLVSELVEEVTKDVYEVEKIKLLSQKLGVEYTTDPIQFLNNVLKAIHFEEGTHAEL